MLCILCVYTDAPMPQHLLYYECCAHKPINCINLNKDMALIVCGTTKVGYQGDGVTSNVLYHYQICLMIWNWFSDKTMHPCRPRLL